MGNSIAVDSAGNAYVTGFTDSTDFPTTAGAFQTTFGGGGQWDAFVAKFALEVQTTTALTTSASPSTYGQSVTFTATISDTAGGVPTGSVEFYDATTDLGPGSILSGSGNIATSTFTTSTLAAGVHSSISAVYTPTGSFVGSSGSLSQTVNPAPLTVTAANESMPYGGTVPALTYTYTGLVNGNTNATFSGGLATTATSSRSVGSYPITRGTLAATGNYTIGTFKPGTLTVNAAPLTITPTAGQSMVYGAAVPTLTYTASGFVNGDPASLLTGELGTTATSTSVVGNYLFTLGSLTAGKNYALALAANPPAFVVKPDGTTTQLASSANPSSFGQAVTYTATVTANAPGSGSPTGTVTFYVGPVNPADQIGSTGTLSSSSGVMTASVSTTSLPVGTDTITATYSGDGDFLTSTGTLTITINQSIIVLDPSAGGALSLAGNACINVPGVVYVDSSSSSALSASGNAQVKAAVIYVHRKVQKSGNASFSPAPVTGAPILANPVASPGAAEHFRPDELRQRKPERELLRDDQTRHLQPDQRFGKRQAHDEQRHLHHPRRRLLRSGHRQRHRLRGDGRQRRQQLSRDRRQIRQHHAGRQRHMQPEPSDERDLCGDRVLPAAGQYEGPYRDRQCLGNHRHDLRPNGPAFRER